MRVRFAPSPTGQLHVGNARTALFNWLVARRTGGAFVLRIEDTDRERSTSAFEQSMLADLRWLGLTWDEGPEVGGNFGPYRQSERTAHYKAAADDLLRRGLAYRCFCSPAQLAAEREEARAKNLPPRYSGRCRGLDPRGAADRVSAGEPAAIRFAVPEPVRDIVFEDRVRGQVRVSTETIGDFVIVRADGSASYNFAVVIDDAAMGVELVVRGEDHIPNTPRQLLLADALGTRPPAYAHLPLVFGDDHTPLSKRHGATSVSEFRARGYLPEALVNYLALLGWSPGGDEEVVPLDVMIERFDLSAVGRSPAVFDFAKLAWINRQYMRTLPADRVVRDLVPFLVQRGVVTDPSGAAVDYVQSLLPMIVGSVDKLEEGPERVAFLFDWDVSQARALVAAEADGIRAVGAMAEAAAAVGPLIDRETFREAVGRARAASGLKGRALLHPVRVALTAADSGPELDIAVPAIDRGAALGADSGIRAIVSCLDRLRRVVAS
jgi:nondiscriminating glutamyl-tRNA synthetase